MILEQAIYRWAQGITEISALLGQGSRLRLTKLTVPQASAMPASVIQRTGTNRSKTACGTINLVQAAVQIDHYGKDWQTAIAVAEVFRLALSDFAGMMGAVQIKDAALVNEFDLDDPEPGLYRRSQSWSIWYLE